jgi:hypothetical protein
MKFKLLLLTYKAIRRTTAPYLSDWISTHHPLKHLRSNKGTMLKQVKTRTSFKRHHKTFLYNESKNWFESNYITTFYLFYSAHGNVKINFLGRVGGGCIID